MAARRRPGHDRRIDPPALLDAACRDEDPELWFAEDDQLEEAREICRGCDAQDACLTWALRSNEQYGIWGGTTPQERRALVRAQHRAA